MKRGPECSEGTSSSYQFWGGELLIFRWKKLFDEKKFLGSLKNVEIQLSETLIPGIKSRKGEPKNLLQKTFVFLDRRLPWKNVNHWTGINPSKRWTFKKPPKKRTFFWIVDLLEKMTTQPLQVWGNSLTQNSSPEFIWNILKLNQIRVIQFVTFSSPSSRSP